MNLISFSIESSDFKLQRDRLRSAREEELELLTELSPRAGYAQELGVSLRDLVL